MSDAVASAPHISLSGETETDSAAYFRPKGKQVLPDEPLVERRGNDLLGVEGGEHWYFYTADLDGEPPAAQRMNAFRGLREHFRRIAAKRQHCSRLEDFKQTQAERSADIRLMGRWRTIAGAATG